MPELPFIRAMLALCCGGFLIIVGIVVIAVSRRDRAEMSLEDFDSKMREIGKRYDSNN